MIDFLLAVDGGGTGTRVILTRPDGSMLARGEAGPSALGQGISAAWVQIQKAIAAAFAQAGLPQPQTPSDWQRCAMAAGLSGVHNTSSRDALMAELPPLAHVVLKTDGYTMLVGAHAGQPGLIVAAGTGSVGEVLHADRSHSVVGGWGFPVGDEGSGSWLGIHAVRIAQAAMDGRVTAGPLARKVWSHCGDNRQDMAAWSAQAAQFAYAQVAPLVFECEDSDPAAAALLAQAARDLEAVAYTLDPQRSLPVAICGSIGNKLKGRMAPELRSRCVEAAMGPAEGALWLLQQSLGGKP
ncbi:MAG: ATPase [Rhodoferax sp.]|nr:ATPase [Rhodoferax sp.]